MAEITAKLVKELREKTGAGMMECKKALVEADGDLNAAIDVLRKRGEAVMEKKAGRATNEGAVMTYICPERGAAGMIEVNCETDFVSSNEKFQAFARNLAEAAAKNPAADLDAFMAVPYGDEGTVADALKETIHLFGENMQIPRFTRIVPEGTGAVVDYVHMGGKLGVLAQFAFENADTAGKDEFKVAARDVCMQIAAANPISVDSDSVDPAVIEHEMEIYKAQAAASGKPEAIQVKIAEGRLHKFFKEQCLVEQEFVKNPDITVADHLAQASKAVGDEISVVRFIRWGLGESAE